MEQNKTRTYLLYAVGEITLVMIGILLALQVNNWNEERKDRMRETELKAQLYTEFSRDLEQLDEKVTMRNVLIQSASKLLDYMEDPASAANDSIAYYFTNTVYRPTFDPTSSEFIARSDLSLIKNQQLKAYLTEWAVNVLQVKEDEYIWSDIRLKNQKALVLGEGVMRNQAKIFTNEQVARLFLIDNKGKFELPFKTTDKEIDYKAVLAHPEMEYFLVACVLINIDINDNSAALRSRILSILELLKDKD